MGRISPHASGSVVIAGLSATLAVGLVALQAGDYKIEFSVGCGDSGFATQWWKDASSAKSATVITVGSTIIGGINASLRR